MPSTDEVAASKALHRRTGKTFYLATKFLPERVRHATYVLYGFFRVADEVVDNERRDSPPVQHRQLADIEAAVVGEAETDDPVLAAFRDLRADVGIPESEVETFLDAMRADIETRRYETYADLERYMRGSAVAVGNMMTAVMDPDDPETALPHAQALGEAFQLTNFLRDVREDIHERDRIYLPRETLDAYGVTEDQIRDGELTPGFVAAMQAELARTEKRYREGVAGISYLPEDCQFPVLLAAVLYADHHRLIRERGYDVLSATPQLSRRRKVALVARTYWHWWRTRDPAAVFHGVTGVSQTDPHHRHPGVPDPAPR